VHGPAILDNAGTDAIAAVVDGVVLVTRQSGATMTDLVQCRTRLDDVGARALGIVFVSSRVARTEEPVDATV
jgi:Mrp family chromosome partitioning ATPase